MTEIFEITCLYVDGTSATRWYSSLERAQAYVQKNLEWVYDEVGNFWFASDEEAKYQIKSNDYARPEI